MPETIADVTDSSEQALACREVGHAWDPTHDHNIVRRGRQVIQFTRLANCLRCGAGRKQVIEVPSFRVVTATITYPDGYLLAGARVHKPDVRREVLNRIVTGAL